MKYSILTAIFAGMFLATATTMCAQDNSQQHLRENPDIDTVPSLKIVIPPYVSLKDNKIALNGADWSQLANKLASSRDSIVSIMFIGDSHLQADMGTAVTRRRMAAKYGYAGRGLTVPFKLAGTNEPIDYKITADCPVSGSRLLKKPWPTHMGFTGIGVSPTAENFTTTITAKEPFDSIEIFFSGDSLAFVEGDSTVNFSTSPLRRAFTMRDTTATFTLTGDPSATIHGINLIEGHNGLLTHVIGNNGATFSTYNELPTFAADVAAFRPALIILSLGTNEAFGKITDAEFYSEIDRMISRLHESCPDASILLTTPSECQRRTGSRRRKRRHASYQVNANVKRLRDVIVQYGADNGIPVYDFYKVAGDTGSSTKWLKDSYLNKDRIHLTRAGYTLQGTLFTNALLDAVENAAAE